MLWEKIVANMNETIFCHQKAGFLKIVNMTYFWLSSLFCSLSSSCIFLLHLSQYSFSLTSISSSHLNYLIFLHLFSLHYLHPFILLRMDIYNGMSLYLLLNCHFWPLIIHFSFHFEIIYLLILPPPSFLIKKVRNLKRKTYTLMYFEWRQKLFVLFTSVSPAPKTIPGT